MATKQMKALKDFKYGTRMLRAGEPVDMKGPDVRLYTAIGAVGPRDADGSGSLLPSVPPTPRAPRKRKAKNSK